MNNMCAIDGCARKPYARGLCKADYQRVRTAGRLEDYGRSLVAAGATLDERLRHHGWTVTDGDCWEWGGSIGTYGYGQLAVGGTRPEVASRAAYMAWVGPIPEGGAICHRCDNPPCINPEHLFLGDKAVNNRDMADKRRTANGERKTSSRLTDAQVAEIRALYATGQFSQKELGARFNVSQQLVGLIARRLRRANLTNPKPTPHYS
jgi:hypothetical protein